MGQKTSCSRIVTYLKKGATGPQGPVGRLPVPYGTYGEQSSYTCTDRIAPVVMFNNLYYVMNKNVTWYVANNNNPAQDYADNGSNATWIYMQNYKAIFAEVFMANLGKIASAVFYDKLMFSQQGIRNGNSALYSDRDSGGNTYLHFTNDGDFDESNAAYFKPNFWVNFYTGKIKAVSGTVGGWNMSASRLYSGSGTTYVGLDSSSGLYAFWAGASDPTNAPFSVTKAGYVKATSGSIGGFTISATAIGTVSTYNNAPQTYLGQGRLTLRNAPGSSVVREVTIEPASGSAQMSIYTNQSDIALSISTKGTAVSISSGEFRGLRPALVNLGSETTINYQWHTVLVQNTAEKTIYLPSNPEKGTYHLILHEGSSSNFSSVKTLHINGNGKQIIKISSGGSTILALGTTLDSGSAEGILCIFDGTYWNTLFIYR